MRTDCPKMEVDVEKRLERSTGGLSKVGRRGVKVGRKRKKGGRGGSGEVGGKDKEEKVGRK